MIYFDTEYMYPLKAYVYHLFSFGLCYADRNPYGWFK